MVIFFSTREIRQSSCVFAGAPELFQAFDQLLIGRENFFLKDLFVGSDQLFLVLAGELAVVLQLLGKNFQHVVGIRVLYKGAALFLDAVKGFVAHKKSGV